MKFSVKLSDLQKLLEKTLPAIPPKSTLPVLEHLHFSLNADNLEVIATDQDITIMSKLQVAGETEGSILVPGRKLNDIVKLLGTEGNITFEADTDNYDIKLKTDDGNYSMKGLNTEEYLDIPELFDSGPSTIEKPDIAAADTGPASASLTKDEMRRLSSKTVFAVSQDEFRQAMTGVLFEFRGNRVNSVATDSYRLSKAVVKREENSFPVELNIILPARSVELLKKVDDDVVVSVIESQGKITHTRFDIDNTVFITKVIAEKFPPYESVIPDSNELMAVVDQRKLMQAIRRVAIFTSEISKQIRLRMTENHISITGKDEEYGTDGSEELPCEYTGKEIEIGFNYRFLEEALQNMDVSEKDDYKLLITFSEPTRPVLIKPKDEENELLMLIMPVRIS